MMVIKFIHGLVSILKAGAYFVLGTYAYLNFYLGKKVGNWHEIGSEIIGKIAIFTMIIAGLEVIANLLDLGDRFSKKD